MSESHPIGNEAKNDITSGLPTIDVNEYGGRKEDGERQAMDRRLFFQLLVFSAVPDHDVQALGAGLAADMERHQVEGVIYDDFNDPLGIGVLTWSEDPSHFVRKVRPLFGGRRASALRLRPEFTMVGRTYALGHEPRLEHVLLQRPRENVLREGWDWAVWYPLRRSGAFARLDPHEQAIMMREHAQIGLAYGQQDLAHDVRLACHGLDAADNEFLVGLVSRTLHPISHCVQAMRKTRQTAEFIAKMGPFFVGHKKHQVRL